LAGGPNLLVIMSDLNLVLDTSALTELGKNLEEFEQELHRAGQLLAGQTHLHILEEAQKRLHSRREMYVKALDQVVEVQPGVWMILLRPEAVWIEEGMPPHSMVRDLLTEKPGSTSKVRTAKDGSRYRVIPFKQNQSPTNQTPAEQELATSIKKALKELRKNGGPDIPWGKIERNADGSPKTGLLHKLPDLTPNRPAGKDPTPNLTNDPNRPPNDHGYGRGPTGEPMQGPGPGGERGGGTPFLRGLRIYQTALFDKDGAPKLNKHGQQMATKSILTFRVVSSKHEGQKWEYPGIEGTHFFDEAMTWAEQEWEKRILPDLLRKLG
jgi:hypothetical protein